MLKNKKILIVDDDVDIAKLLSVILKRHGFIVYTHLTGYDVVELVQRENPDLVLLDINLPGKLGTEICKELKRISNHPPILLLSAHSHKEDAFMTCEADGFISKPFEIESLLEKIKLHVS